MLEHSYLHAVFKVRRFPFSAFSLTLAIVETLRTNIVSWYIEILSKYYTRGKLYTCTATYKKIQLGKFKIQALTEVNTWGILIYFFQKWQWSRKYKLTSFK